MLIMMVMASLGLINHLSTLVSVVTAHKQELSSLSLLQPLEILVLRPLVDVCHQCIPLYSGSLSALLHIHEDNGNGKSIVFIFMGLSKLLLLDHKPNI